MYVLSYCRRAAVRKLKHELGIEGLNVDDMAFLTRILYVAESDSVWGEHEIDYILFARMKEIKADPNPNEVSAVRYATQDEVKELMSKEVTTFFSVSSNTPTSHACVTGREP